MGQAVSQRLQPTQSSPCRPQAPPKTHTIPLSRASTRGEEATCLAALMVAGTISRTSVGQARTQSVQPMQVS